MEQHTANNNPVIYTDVHLTAIVIMVLCVNEIGTLNTKRFIPLNDLVKTVIGITNNSVSKSKILDIIFELRDKNMLTNSQYYPNAQKEPTNFIDKYEWIGFLPADFKMLQEYYISSYSIMQKSEV